MGRSTVASDAIPFLDTRAYQRLATLKKIPPDLTKELTGDRIRNYFAEAAGWKLLFGTERINDAILDALFELAEERKVIEKMGDMQGGVVVNQIEGFPSEHRPALHTATRDVFEDKKRTAITKQASELAKKELHKLEAWASEAEDRFDTLIVIGIGGSDLGPRALFHSLQHLQKTGTFVYFISNLDPDDITRVLEQVNLKRTVVAVVSKSGSTLETATNEEILRIHFENSDLNSKEHFISVTSPGSLMDRKDRYYEVFHVWDWVGGRYSSTSAVGGIPLSFACGFEVFSQLLKGANEMDQCALSVDARENLPLLGALLGIWNRNFLDCQALGVIPYSSALKLFPSHLQQLDMESNGKSVDKKGHFVKYGTGPLVMGEPGTNAQHSFFQSIHQGTTVVPLEFIGFEECIYKKDMEIGGTTSQEKLLANLFAQSLALAEGKKSDNPARAFSGNRPSHILLAKELTPEVLGALLSYYENKVAMQGFIWGINSFDQEGVQLGKKLADKMLALFRGDKNEDFPLGKSFLTFLDNSN